MNAVRRLAAVLTTALMSLAIHASAQQPSDAERTLLARSIVDVILPASEAAQQTEAFVKASQEFVQASAALSARVRSLDSQQLEASVGFAARTASAEIRTALIEALAAALTADELRATLAFSR
jgi:hypothetical protein